MMTSACKNMKIHKRYNHLKCVPNADFLFLGQVTIAMIVTCAFWGMIIIVHGLPSV